MTREPELLVVNRILTVTLGSLHWSIHWCLAEYFQIRAKRSCLFAANTRIKSTLIFMYFVYTLAWGHAYTWGVDKNHWLHLFWRCKGPQSQLNSLLTWCGIKGDPAQHMQAECIIRCDVHCKHVVKVVPVSISIHFFQKKLGDNSFISDSMGKMTEQRKWGQSFLCIFGTIGLLSPESSAHICSFIFMCV